MLFQVMTRLLPEISLAPACSSVEPGGFQIANPYEGFPPALTKYPPTWSAPSLNARVRTLAGFRTLPAATPLPSADHALPFQRAMLLARIPHAFVKLPPT